MSEAPDTRPIPSAIEGAQILLFTTPPIPDQVTDQTSSDRLLAALVPDQPHDFRPEQIEAPSTTALFGGSEALKPRHAVRGLGQCEVIRSRLITLGEGADPRVVGTVRAILDDAPYYMRIIEADPAESVEGVPTPVIGILHGLTEMADGGSAKDYVDAIATRFKGHRIISFYSEGVSRYADRLTWAEGWHKNFDLTAEACQRLFKAYSGEGLFSLVDISMGFIKGVKMLRHNKSLELAKEDGLDPDLAHDEPLHIEQVHHHSPADIQASTAIWDIPRFLGHIGSDVFRAARRNPELRTKGRAIGRALFRSGPGLVGDIKNIAMGIPAEHTIEAATTYPTTYYIGTGDTLSKRRRLFMLAALYPGQVNCIDKAGVGHDACMYAQEMADDIFAMHDESIVPDEKATASS